MELKSPLPFKLHIFFLWMIFTSGFISKVGTLKKFINLFSKSTRMLINEEKSTLTTFLLSDGEKGLFIELFPFS